MELQQFEQIFWELSRQEKRQFAEYINEHVVDLHEMAYPYDEKNPLSKNELIDVLKSREDALETIVLEEIDEAKDWLEKISMS